MNSRKICCLTLLGLFATAARADDPPRWQLSTGDVLNYRIEKRAELTIAEAPESFVLLQSFKSQWKVQEVGEDGVAVVDLIIEHANVEMEDPLGKLDYDSSQDDPGGVIALAGPIYDEMLENPIRFRIAPDGKIDDFQVPKELMEAMKNSSISEQLADFNSREALRRILLPLFPNFDKNEYATGDTWSVKWTEGQGQLGKQEVETAFTYQGSETKDGDTIARFKLDRTLTVPPEQETKIASQESTGELLFNLTQGRLLAADLQLDVQLNFPKDGETVLGQLLQTTIVELLAEPAGEDEDQ